MTELNLIASGHFIGPLKKLEHNGGKQYLFQMASVDKVFTETGERHVITTCWFIFEGGFVDLPLTQLQWGDRITVSAHIRQSELAELVLGETNGLYATSVTLISRGNKNFLGTDIPIPEPLT